MNLIPITPATIDMITVLNEGVRPEMTDKQTFYVWNGPDEYANILTELEVEEQMPEWMTVIKICYINLVT